MPSLLHAFSKRGHWFIEEKNLPFFLRLQQVSASLAFYSHREMQVPLVRFSRDFCFAFLIKLLKKIANSFQLVRFSRYFVFRIFNKFFEKIANSLLLVTFSRYLVFRIFNKCFEKIANSLLLVKFSRYFVFLIFNNFFGKIETSLQDGRKQQTLWCLYNGHIPCFLWRTNSFAIQTNASTFARELH
jgi:hypothetical protein